MLLQMSNYSFTRTYNDSELMSELDAQMSDLYVMEIKQTEGEAEVVAIAVNVANNESRFKRYQRVLYVFWVMALLSRTLFSGQIAFRLPAQTLAILIC